MGRRAPPPPRAAARPQGAATCGPAPQQKAGPAAPPGTFMEPSYDDEPDVMVHVYKKRDGGYGITCTQKQTGPISIDI